MDQTPDIYSTLCRLARFGANISDAHSCFIFLPAELLQGQGSVQEQGGTLVLAGYHSLSDDVLTSCNIRRDSGLIGWVSKHGKSIHVSPFEHDSRTLGIYRSDQKLKSFIGIPVPLFVAGRKKLSAHGVIACDSKKSYAFSKIQGKLLDDLAREVSEAIRLILLCEHARGEGISWHTFTHRAEELRNALGVRSVEVLRVRIKNVQALEQSIGAGKYVDAISQIGRLIEQSLPPHFPLFTLPHGEWVVALDNMMTSFYQNKMSAIAEHVLGMHRQRSQRHDVPLEFSSASCKERSQRSLGIEDLIKMSCFSPSPAPQRQGNTSVTQRELAYEYRRA